MQKSIINEYVKKGSFADKMWLMGIIKANSGMLRLAAECKRQEEAEKATGNKER